MIDPTVTAELLEELATNAWPSLYRQQLECWTLRAGDGTTRRANSVYTAGSMPGYPGWMAEIKHFYRRRGLPVRFQISTASPQELSDLLDKLRYTFEAETWVEWADANDIAAKCDIRTDFDVQIQPALTEDWLDNFMRIEEHDEVKRNGYRAIMSHIGPAVRFVQVRAEGKIVGIGTAVYERGWAGLFNLATVPRMRGQGVATSILGLLARWSLEQGGDYLYLQVMQSNETALNLYRKLGFAPLYSYHYRVERGGESL